MFGRGPHLVVLGGPNGAGKSTAAPALLKGALGVTEFVNADAIALGLSAFAAERAGLAAGRVMLQRLRDLALQRIDFAFESTLASRSFAPWIDDLRSTGYRFDLIFLWLPSPDEAVARVQERVRSGGHDVPADTIRRRYVSGLRNLFQLYLPVADTWQVFDSSLLSGPRRIARGGRSKATSIRDPKIWEMLTRAYNHA